MLLTLIIGGALIPLVWFVTGAMHFPPVFQLMFVIYVLLASKPAASSSVDSIARGMEVYDLHECYNCHKIGGKGSVKKRGPVLDNIGSYLTPDDIKKKVFDPGYLYADGFEKEHKKKQM